MAARKKAAKAKKGAATRTFDDVLQGVEAPVAATARHLRKLVRTALKDADEGVFGGAKVAIVLYSLDGPNNVVCGIQPAGERCLFYLHRIDPGDAPELELTGKGKHARHVAFASWADVPDRVLKRLIALSVDRLD